MFDHIPSKLIEGLKSIVSFSVDTWREMNLHKSIITHSLLRELKEEKFLDYN